MGKEPACGSALINSCRRQKKQRAQRYAATGEVEEAANKKQALQSVTTRDVVSDFLYNAELTQQRFEGLRQQKLLHGDRLVFESRPKLPAEAAEESAALREISFLRIPRRPDWAGKTADAQKRDEALAFVQWRKDLAALEQRFPAAALTPYEKNLEVWRQLWHVVEKAAVLFQIVDARDFAFFRCEDLEQLVAGFPGKRNFLVLNKADLLPPPLIDCLSAHLQGLGVPHVFFSAKAQLELLEREEAGAETATEAAAEFPTSSAKVFSRAELLGLLRQLAEEVAAAAELSAAEQAPAGDDCAAELLRGLGARRPPGQAVFGMVGFPNVGKSSLINALTGGKRVGVGSRPGKTKNYQTVNLAANLAILDCPGLVFPSLVFSKWKMIVNGVLPIDNLTEHIAPVEYLLGRVPTQLLVELYQLPVRVPPAQGAPLGEECSQIEGRAPGGKESLQDAEVNTAFRLSAREFLQIFASTRGLVTGAGLPDESKAAKQVLRDCVEGKLPHFELPAAHRPVVEEEFRARIKAAFNPQKMPLKNVRRDDLIVEEKRNVARETQQRLREENAAQERKERVGVFARELTEGKVLDLIEGKSVDGFCLDKADRRALKYMVKGDARPEEILAELQELLLGKKDRKRAA